MPPLEHHRQLGREFSLPTRPALGYVTACYEIVPAGATSPDRFVPGRPSPDALGMVTSQWSTRRVPARRIAHDLALGREPAATEKVTVWSAWALNRGRKPRRLSGDLPSLDDALAAFMRHHR